MMGLHMRAGRLAWPKAKGQTAHAPRFSFAPQVLRCATGVEALLLARYDAALLPTDLGLLSALPALRRLAFGGIADPAWRAEAVALARKALPWLESVSADSRMGGFLEHPIFRRPS